MAFMWHVVVGGYGLRGDAHYRNQPSKMHKNFITCYFGILKIKPTTNQY